MIMQKVFSSYGIPSEFLLIIKKQDEEKFRQFQIGRYNKQTMDILENNSAKYIWGLHKGIINNKIWSKIKKNDKIYLTVKGENFKIFGTVSKKIKNSKYGKLLYPESIDKKQINYFLFFDKLDTCRIPYQVLKNRSKSRIFAEEGIYEINEKSHPEKIEKIKVKELPFEKIIGKAKRRRIKIEGFVRNSPKVKKLKELYNNKCQITRCGFRLEYISKNKKKSSYSEVHHYNPLKKEADDDWGNMIVLCPNHHTEFDFGVKFIHSNGTTIINQYGKETGETIKFNRNHKLDMKNIEILLGE